MKKIVLKLTVVAGGFLFFLGVLSTPSCKKDATCHGKIKVLDSIGTVVQGADVLLAAPSVNGDVTYTGTTDAAGNVSFEIKLPAIFDIKATKSTYPGKIAKGILRVDEPGKTEEVSVTLK